MYANSVVKEKLKNANVKLSNLTEIADYYETDKGNIKHLYTPIYESIIGNLKNISLLEIGIANGSSLRAWSHYYPESKITGIDINPNCKILCKDNDKINIIISDVLEYNFDEKYDVIIDDGSHIPRDMIHSFTNLIICTRNIFSRYVFKCHNIWFNYWRRVYCRRNKNY